MASDIWLRTILIVRNKTRCRHIGYSFRLTARCFFYMHHPTDRIAHTTAFVTPVVKHWLERDIAQWVHPMKDRSDDQSHHERTLLPRSYISLERGRERAREYICLYIPCYVYYIYVILDIYVPYLYVCMYVYVCIILYFVLVYLCQCNRFINKLYI